MRAVLSGVLMDGTGRDGTDAISFIKCHEGTTPESMIRRRR